ncbi:MAG: hypothetical protein AAF316_15965 [Cyanobacteria bacterium P01_A01_bin.80]
MGNPFFSGRIPKELFQKAEQYIKENDMTKTDLLIEALAQYLNFSLKRNIPESEITLEMFNDLKERLEKLESIVISNDNKIDNNRLDTDEASDNKEDNIGDNKNQNDILTDNTDDKEYDNDKFILVSHANLPKLIGITTGDRGNLRNRAYESARKKGYEIVAGIIFKPAIEVKLKKGIEINGEKAVLLCKGIDETGKPEWIVNKK